MPLSLQDQLDLAIRSLTMADIDTLTKVMTDPASITPAENQTAAQKLGIKNKFLAAITNSAMDPTVWMAFMMSRRFPSLHWLTGEIPTRFIGAANEFNGISKYTRPVETYFRGTPIPRLTSLAMQRQAEVMKVGEQLFHVMDRPNWNEEMPIVSMLLEGQSHPQATSEHRVVADQIRGKLNELWGFLSQTKRVTGGFEGTEWTRARSEDWLQANAPKYLRDYLPHIPLLGDETIINVSGKDALKRMGMGSVGKIIASAGEDAGKVWTPDAVGRLTSDFSRYQGFLNSVKGQVWNENLFKRSRMDIPLQSALGQELFVTDLNTVLQKYVHGVAKTYSVNAPLSNYERVLASARIKGEDGKFQTIMPSADPIAVQVINYGIDAAGGRVISRGVPGTPHTVELVDPSTANPIMMTGLRHLTRALTGKMDEGQIMWGNLFASVGKHFDETVGRITNKQRGEVDYAMKAVQRNRSWRNIANGITNYFHTATLGGNAWSAIQNLLQPMLTTAPALGIGPTLSGMRQAWARVPEYAAEIRNQHDLLRDKSLGPLARMNEAADLAFKKVFPDLAEVGIRPDIRLLDADPSMLIDTHRGKLFKSYDSFSKWLLQPFNHAEFANQATTFYAAKQSIGDAIRQGLYHVPEGLTPEEVRRYVNFDAINVVNATQFRPGPGTRSIWQGSVPSFLRQFTTFPTRAASFMVESTVRGAMTEKELENAGMLQTLFGGRNWGTLARMFMYGKLMNNGARDVLGIDLGNALGVTSPFNLAPAGRFLSPLPVPPVIGTAYGVLSSAATRDIKEMQPMTIPGYGDIPIPKQLVPGGVALNRVLRGLNQWRPDLGGFVDDNERLMYEGNTTDLVLSMIGVPLDKNRRAREAIDRTHDVRTRVKDFRRKFALAAMNGDTGQMNMLQAQYQKTFPGWPGLEINQQDLNRYKTAARIPTIQRMMQTMGEAGKYLQSEMYEVDPDLLAPQDVGQPMGAFGLMGGM